MENIFKGAYFGKPYVTKDSRKALYIKGGELVHYLAVKDSIDTVTYDEFGTTYFEDEDWNIVSDYNGTANEQADAFDDFWKTNMMDARFKVLGLNEVQKQQMKIQLELAFMAGHNNK